MFYFYFLGTLVLTLMFCICLLKHITYNMIKRDRIVFIVKQIVSITLYGVILYYADIFLQGLIPTETINFIGCIVIYISLSLYWGYLATYISNHLIDFIYKKFIFPFFNKCKKADEILPSDPNFKVLIHFNHSDDTSFNISAKRSIIPSDIMLKVVGTNTYINKDNRIWIQSVYACKNLSDENRLKQIVYKSSYSDMGQLLAELKGQSVNPSISAK